MILFLANPIFRTEPGVLNNHIVRDLLALIIE